MTSQRTRPRPLRSRVALAAVGVFVVLLAACGGDDAEQVVRDTHAKLGEIRSGRLSMRVEIVPRGGDAAGPVGLRLDGPFSLALRGRLPIARVRYIQLAGAERASATLLSTGNRAYVELEGTPYRLPPAREDELAAALGGEKRGEGLDVLGLDIAAWIEDARREDAADDELTRVTGRLDIVAALRDLLNAAGRVGGEGLDIDERAADGLRESVRSSSIELITGAEDDLLRSVRLELDFEAPTKLQPLLGGFAGGRLVFALQIQNANEPVRVSEPKDAQPASVIGIE